MKTDVTNCMNDNQKAMELYERAMQLKNGDGGKQNINEAINYLKEASNLGNADAALELGICYAYGIGTNRDTRRSREYYQMGADLGNADAMFRLFQSLSIDDGEGVELSEADMWLKKSADLGHDKAIDVLNHFSAQKELNDDLVFRKETKNYDIEMQAPDNRLQINNNDETKEDTVVLPPFPQSLNGDQSSRILILYLVFGVVTAFLLMPVFDKTTSILGSQKILSFFGSTGAVRVYLIVIGLVTGVIWSLISYAIGGPGINEIIHYIPALLMPVFVLINGSLIVSLLKFLLPLFQIALYICMIGLPFISTWIGRRFS